MSRERRCEQGGLLAGVDWPMPTAFSEFGHPGDPSAVPCARLGCERCGAAVRWRDGLQREDTAGPVSELYEAMAGIGPLPATERYRPSRFYVCRCAAWAEDLVRPLQDPERGPLDPILPPWRCIGHPQPDEGVRVDGVDIGGEAESLPERVAGGWSPSGVVARLREQPALWLSRAVAQAEGTDAGERLARAVALGVLGGGGPGSGVAAVVARWNGEFALREDLLTRLGTAPPGSLGRVELPPAGVGAHPAGVSFAEALAGGLLRGCGDEDRRRRAIGLLWGLVKTPGTPVPGDVWAALAAWDGVALARSLPALVTVRQGVAPQVLAALAAAAPELPVLGGIALLRGSPDLCDEVAAWVNGPEAAGTPWAMALRAALAAPIGEEDVTVLLAAVRDAADAVATRRAAARLASREPELFFDLAVELADAEPWRRRAVWEGARDGAPHWWSAHREDLAQALDVET